MPTKRLGTRMLRRHLLFTVAIIKHKYGHNMVEREKIYKIDYSGPAAHLGRSLAQLDRASAHLIQSAFRHMPIADQPIY